MNIVVVGCGRYAKAVHIPFIQASPTAELAGTVDPQPVVNVQNLNAPHRDGVDGFRDFLSSVRADGVIISTPPSKRRPVYDAMFGEPVHIHVDKPFLADSDADRLASDLSAYQRRATHHPLPVSIHSQRRYDTYIERCKQAIESVTGKTGVIPHRIRYDGTDGNFRTLREWNHDTYHGLQGGLGIIAHSYYHYIDTVAYLLESIPVTVETIDVSPTWLNDIKQQNNLAEQALLGTRSTGDAPGPIEVETRITFKARDGRTMTTTLFVSHQGVTRRHGAVDDHLAENRYSQKHLSVHAGSMLSASIDSRTVSLDKPKRKEDRLRIDNAAEHETTTATRRREGSLDEKRRQCLTDYVNGWKQGTRNKSIVSSHSLTNKVYAETARAVLRE